MRHRHLQHRGSADGTAPGGLRGASPPSIVEGGGEVDDVTRRVLKGPKIRMIYPGSVGSSRRSDALAANSSGSPGLRTGGAI